MRDQKDQIIWGNVERILKDKGWTLVDLAKKMEVTPQAINSLKTRGIGQRSIKKLSAALNIDEIQLLLVEVPTPFSRPIPIISWVQAGLFADAEDHWPVGISGEGDPVFSYRKVGLHAFGLRVVGDSMAPRYLPGDTIIVDPELKCDNGSPCVVVLNGEAVFKFFKDTPEAIILEPMNPKHPDIIIRKDRSVDFRVVGKVVDLIPKMDILTSNAGFTEEISVVVKRDGNIVE